MNQGLQSFFQSYYLPEKFNYDKRRAHLSSLILAGQITREQALIEMEQSVYTTNELCEDREYICKKLDISVDEFDKLMNAPKRLYSDFPSDNKLRLLLYKIKRLISKKRFSVKVSGELFADICDLLTWINE